MRWIVRILTGFLALFVAAVAFLFLLPAERIGQLASDQLQRQTGRTLTLSDEFRPTIWPVLGVRTGAVTVSNADWATTPTMVTADAAAVGVNLASLVGGDLRVETLRLERPVVHLERAVDGRVNWDLGGGGDPATTQPAPDGSGGTLSLELGEIIDGAVIYTDRETGKVTELRDLNGTLSLPSGKLEASAELEGVLNGTPGKLAFNAGDWAGLLQGKASAIDVVVSALGADVLAKGRLGTAGTLPSFDGTLKLSLESPAGLAEFAGVQLPEQVAGLRDVIYDGQVLFSDAGVMLDGALGADLDGTRANGRLALTGQDNWAETLAFGTELSLVADKVLALAFDGEIAAGAALNLAGNLDLDAGDLRRVLALGGVAFAPPAGSFNSGSVKARVSVGENGQIILSDGRFRLDGNSLSGRIAVTPSATPHVSAALSGGALDLSAFTSDSADGGGGSGGGGSGWSREPIAVSGLDAVNADLALAAESVNLGPTQLGRTDIAIKLRDGVATVALNEVRAFDGALAGNVTLRGGSGISFDSNIRANGVALEPLLGELAGITRLSGSGRTTLNLSGQGGTVHDLMNSLSGTGDVEFTQGAIKGIDLAAMMRNLQKAFGGFEGATEFTSLTGTFSMDQGVLQNIDLSLISPLFRAGGKGSVDVGGQAMNYVVTPTRLAEGAEFSVPVIITGAWSDLKFRPDLEKLANLILNSDLENSEQVRKAKEKLEEVKAIVDNPEDAIKDKLKRELERKLGGRLAAVDPVAEPVPSTGGGIALSVPGNRPRLRPADLQTAVAAPAPVAEPAPVDSRSTEERVKDAVEDKAKRELKKLFKLGD